MPTHPSRAAIAVGTQARTIDDDDALIAQREVKRLAGEISDMTVWRWRRAGILPEPLRIRNRNYWRRREVVAALTAAGSAGLSLVDG